MSLSIFMYEKLKRLYFDLYDIEKDFNQINISFRKKKMSY